MSNRINKMISWEWIIVICIMCLVIASIIIVYFVVNPTDPTMIAQTCLNWAKEHDCLCGITNITML